MKYSGKHFNVAFVKESPRGTLTTSGARWHPHTELSLQDRTEVDDDNSSVGISVDSIGSELAAVYADGSIGGKVRNVDIVYPLAMIGGKFPTSALKSGETEVYEHTIIPELTTNTHATTSLLINSPIADEGFALAHATNLEITYDPKKLAEYKLDVVAKASASTTVSPSFNEDKVFVGRMAKCQIADTLSNAAAATAAKVQMIKIKHTKSVEREHDCDGNDGNPSDMDSGPIVTTIELDLYYENNTNRDLYRANTKRAVIVTLQDPNVTIGEESHPEVRLEIPLAKLEWSRELPETSARQKVTLKTEWLASDPVPYRYVVTNTTASY